MEQQHSPIVHALLLQAEALPAPQRRAFLDQACAGDAALRAQLETLLRAEPETRAVPPPSRISTHTGDGGERPGALAAGTRLGAWRVEHLVGHGGMGEVYAAQRADGLFERRAAVKLLKRGLDSEALLARFNRERRILARLDHPNIAHVLDAGVAPDGRPFLVMEYVDGQPINEYVGARDLPVSEQLRLFITVCEAVQAAHDQQVVHRDLKPSNVLVTAQGQVKLLDFGVAKALTEDDGDSTRQLEQQAPLTPGYAAPEQILGLQPGPASDVYALGCMLFQLLTERMPHARAGSWAGLLQGLGQETVNPPSSVLRRERGRLPEPLRLARLHAISPDLDLIVLKALRAEPQRRYGCARELGEDLARLLAHRPVLARPDSLAYRVGRFVRRNRRTLLQLATAASAFVLLGGGAALLEARQQRLAAQQRYVQRLGELGREQLERNDYTRAAVYLGRAYQLGDDSVTLRRLLARAMVPVDALAPQPFVHEGFVYDAAFSHDGAMMLATGSGGVHLWHADGSGGNGLALTGAPQYPDRAGFSPDDSRLLVVGTEVLNGTDHHAVLWDGSGSVVARLDARIAEDVYTPFAPDGSAMIGIGNDGGARLWNPRDGRELALLPTAKDVTSIAFSPSAQAILIGERSGAISCWDRGLHRRWQITVQPALAVKAFFSPDGTRVVSVSDSGSMRSWSADNGALLDAMGGHSSGLLKALFSRDGRRLVTVARDGFKVWDFQRATELLSGPMKTPLTNSIGLSPDGERLLVPQQGGQAALWDLAQGQLLYTLSGHTAALSASVFSPDGQRILTASVDGTVRLWDARRLAPRPLFSVGHGHSIDPTVDDEALGAAFDAAGKRFVTAASDGLARVWDAASGAPLLQLSGHTAELWSAAFSPDGTRIVTASGDHTARIWDARDGRQLQLLAGHGGAVKNALFSPDGSLVLTTSADHSLRVWRADSGQALATVGDFDDRLVSGRYAAAFSPDSSRVVLASQREVAEIHDARSGKLLAELGGFTGPLGATGFSPDGAWVLAASGDNSARIAATDGRPLYTMHGRHLVNSSDDQFWCARMAHHLPLAALCSRENAAFLWLPLANRVMQLVGPETPVLQAEFSPDDSLLGTVQRDGSAMLWDTARGTLIERIQAHVGWARTIAFSADGERLLTLGVGENNAKMWDVHLERRTPAQLDATLRCKVPWQVSGETLAARDTSAAACAGAAP